MKRYKLTWDSLDEHQDGNYVLFSEADARIKELEARIKALDHDEERFVGAANKAGIPLWADGFRRGRNSVLKDNKSGCCCLFNEQDEIVSLCIAHKEREESWKREYRLINAAKLKAEERVKELEGHLPFEARCPECGWFGMSDDCRYMKCPNCEGRVGRKA